MEAVEFIGRVIDGRIEIPRQFRDRLGERVRVIVFAAEAPEEGDDAIEALLAHPLMASGFRPLGREAAHARDDAA